MRTILALVLSTALVTPAFADKPSQNDNGSILGRPATHGRTLAVTFDPVTGDVASVDCPGLSWGELNEPTQHIASKRLAAIADQLSESGLDCSAAIAEVKVAIAQAAQIEADAKSTLVLSTALARNSDVTSIHVDLERHTFTSGQAAEYDRMMQFGYPVGYQFGLYNGVAPLAQQNAAWQAAVAPPVTVPAPAPQPTADAKPPSTTTTVVVKPDAEAMAAKDLEIARLRAQLDHKGHADAEAMFPKR